MSFRQLWVVLASLLLVVPLIFSVSSVYIAKAQSEPDVYLGIDIGYELNASEAKKAIDRVSSFTNFIVLGSTSLSRNLTQLNESLQYAYDKGMYFMSFPPTLGVEAGLINASKVWLEFVRANWGNHLVGFLYPWEDEPGGHQLDRANDGYDYHPVINMNATDYADAERQFIDSLWFQYLRNASKILGYPLFTSDYALYWFDYKGGYDGLFAEFGWNYSAQINVATCRGAATVLNKEWGTIITYTYTEPPYMESPEDLYKDLMYAYDNGAKYIVVLDTNVDWTSGCLTEEHFQVIREFWEYATTNPRKCYPVTERVAYQLPPFYGYGFRGPLDKDQSMGKIWGIWDVDITSFFISAAVSIMLDRYGTKLDIIYEEPDQPNQTYSYSQIIRWDEMEAVADDWPTLPPWPKSTPDSTATPQPTPTGTLNDVKPPGFIGEYLLAATSISVVSVVGVAFVLKRKRNVPGKLN